MVNYKDLWNEIGPSKSPTVNAIREYFLNDEFKAIVVCGDHGWGKSCFASFVASEIYQTWAPSTLKEYIVFKPQEFLEKICTKTIIKRPLLIWDDAGYWLNALDYQNKFVKAVGKYMQVARPDWGCVIFTSIDVDDIASKIRGIPNRLMVTITKDGCGKDTPDRRTAITFKGWKTPDRSKYGEETLWDEYFYARMPQNFYEWYKPYRESFTRQAKDTMLEYVGEII